MPVDLKDYSDINIKMTISAEVLAAEEQQHFDILSESLKNNELVSSVNEPKAYLNINSNENPAIMSGKVNNEEFSIDYLSAYRKSYPFSKESHLNDIHGVVGQWENDENDIFVNEAEVCESEIMYNEFETGIWNVMEEEERGEELEEEGKFFRVTIMK